MRVRIKIDYFKHLSRFLKKRGEIKWADHI